MVSVATISVLGTRRTRTEQDGHAAVESFIDIRSHAARGASLAFRSKLYRKLSARGPRLTQAAAIFLFLRFYGASRFQCSVAVKVLVLRQRGGCRFQRECEVVQNLGMTQDGGGLNGKCSCIERQSVICIVAHDCSACMAALKPCKPLCYLQKPSTMCFTAMSCFACAWHMLALRFRGSTTVLHCMPTS